jgi:pimeloyl-ACP methyl ester carboxylesterase
VVDVRVEGSGPPVVLLHSAVADLTMWDEVAAALRPNHTVIRYDLCGFGASPAPTAPFRYVDELAAVLDQVGVPAAAVVGNSMGGGIALRFTTAVPDRVTQLVLLGSGGGIPDWTWSAVMDEYHAAEEAAVEAGDLDAAMRINLDMWVRGPLRSWTPSLEALAERITGPLRVSLEHQAAIDEHCQDVRPGPLGEVRVPVLIGVGDFDVPDFTALGERMVAELPDASLVHFSESGHLIPLEAPEQTAAELSRFLKSTV